MAEITIKIVPVGQRTDALDCTECGVLNLQPHDKVDEFIYDHLFQFHGCNPDTTEIRSI